MYSLLKEPPTSYNLQAPLSPPLTQHLALFYRYTFSATQVTMSHGGPALNLSTLGHLQGGASFPWPTLIPVPSLREHGAGPLRLDRKTVQRHFLICAHSDRCLLATSIPGHSMSTCVLAPLGDSASRYSWAPIVRFNQTSHCGSPELSGKPKPGQRAN